MEQRVKDDGLVLFIERKYLLLDEGLLHPDDIGR